MKLRSFYAALVAIVLVGAIGGTAVTWADNTSDPIKSRREKMKANGDAAKIIGGMLEGKVAFDAAKAAEALGVIKDVGHEFGAEFDEYFPKDSFTGDTKALPKIADNADDFKKIAMSLETDAGAAIEATKAGEDQFKAAAGKMFGNCKSCHEAYKMSQ